MVELIHDRFQKLLESAVEGHAHRLVELLANAEKWELSFAPNFIALADRREDRGLVDHGSVVFCLRGDHWFLYAIQKKPPTRDHPMMP